jgi:AcrR family transcriptional regulator
MGTIERKARERAGRENQILDAAEKVFFAQGFDQSTMDDVAKVSELSKGSLYNYFKNKNELCIGIVSRSLQVVIEYMEKAVSANVCGLDKIEAAAKALLSFQKENPEYYCALQNYRQHSCGCVTSSKFLKLTLKENNHISGIFKKAIEFGIEDGSIREDIVPEKAAEVFWGEANGVLSGVDLNSLSNEIYEYTVKLIINGLKK